MTRVAIIVIVVCALLGAAYFLWVKLVSQIPPCPIGQPIAVVTAVTDIPTGAVLQASDVQVVQKSKEEVRLGMITNPTLVIGKTTRHEIRKGAILFSEDFAPRRRQAIEGANSAGVVRTNGYIRIQNKPMGTIERAPNTIDESDSNITESKMNIKY